MTGKYTPGPWGLAGTAGIAVGTTEQESAVAVCVCQGTRTVGEAQANARLIAAAPDLLEALKKLLEEKDDYMRRNNLGDPMKESVSKIARAAIAKAEGRA